MKKYIILSVFVLVSSFIFGSHKASAIEKDSTGGITVTVGDINTDGIDLKINLNMGSKGEEVIRLQNFLIAKGYLMAGNNTGFFGAGTSAAVKKFQIANGLEPVGIVGPASRVKLNSLLKTFTITPTPVNDAPQSTVSTNSTTGSTTKQSASCDNLGKQMININTDGKIKVLGKLTAFGFIYSVSSWGYNFYSNQIDVNLIGNVTTNYTAMAIGDTVEIIGAANPGGNGQIAGNVRPTFRDVTVDCKSVQVTPAVQ